MRFRTTPRTNDIVDGVSGRANARGILIGDVQIEGILQGHDHFDKVERVATKIVREGRGRNDERAIHAMQLHRNDGNYVTVR